MTFIRRGESTTTLYDLESDSKLIWGILSRNVAFHRGGGQAEGVDGGHSERSPQSQGGTYGKQSCPRDPLSPGLALSRGLGWDSGADWKEEMKHKLNISVINFIYLS